MNRSKLRVQLLELESERRKFERLLQVATPAALSGLPASLSSAGTPPVPSSNKSITDEPPNNTPQSAASTASGAPQPVAQADSSESSASTNALLPTSAASTAPAAATAAAPSRRHAPAAPPRRPLPRPTPFEQADLEPRHYGPTLGPFAQRAGAASSSIAPPAEQQAAVPSRRVNIPAMSARDDAGLYEEIPEFE